MNIIFKTDKYNPDWVSVLVELPGELPVKVEENISYNVKNPTQDQIAEWQQKAKQIKQKQERYLKINRYYQAEDIIKQKYPKKCTTGIPGDKIKLWYKNGKFYKEFLVDNVLAGKF